MKITKNSFYRAVRTFIQSSLAYICVNMCLVDFTSGSAVLKCTIIGLVVSAVAAGISAIMNMEVANNDDNGLVG